jgi:hypothetical protein
VFRLDRAVPATEDVVVMEFDASMISGSHALLATFVGDWRGVARLWLEPGVLTCEDSAQGRVESVAGGRFLRFDYTALIDSDAHAGMALIGCALTPMEWQVAWVDTFHNGTEIMLSKGPATADAKCVDVLGSYGATPPGPPWGWRTTMCCPSSDRFLVQHFNVTPAGEEALGAEFDLARR